MSDQARRPQRKSFAEQSVGDLLRSIVLLLLIIGGLWAISGVVQPDDEARTPSTVDYTERLALARGRADYRVLAPHGLGPRWRATSADLSGRGHTVRWHLGFLTPGEEYVGLEQSNRNPRALLGKYVGDLRRSGELAVAGQTWRLYRGETDTALVRRTGDAVTIVVGTASDPALRSFTESLR